MLRVKPRAHGPKGNAWSARKPSAAVTTCRSTFGYGAACGSHHCVVPGSTPVVAFGDPRGASVATLGINPSLWEFCASDPTDPERKYLLEGEQRRLMTLDALGRRSPQEVTPEEVRQVVEECTSYFERPTAFWRWFRVLLTADCCHRGPLHVPEPGRLPPRPGAVGDGPGVAAPATDGEEAVARRGSTPSTPAA